MYPIPDALCSNYEYMSYIVLHNIVWGCSPALSALQCPVLYQLFSWSGPVERAVQKLLDAARQTGAMQKRLVHWCTICCIHSSPCSLSFTSLTCFAIAIAMTNTGLYESCTALFMNIYEPHSEPEVNISKDIVLS